MGSVRRYAAINAKIKSLEGLLLNNDDYRALIECDEPEEIISYLQQSKAYGDLLESNDLKNLDINGIERCFKADVVEKFERLSHYFSDVYKKFYKTLFMRYEIEDIKLYLRTFLRNEPVEFLADHIQPTKYHQINLKDMRHIKSIEDFVDELKETKYHRLLNYYLDEDPEKIMFYMEMSLDHYYFKSLHKQLSDFSDEDKMLMKESIGKNIDIQNLQWIFRGLKYYGLSPEELLNYTLDIGLHLKYKDLKALCYTKDMASFVAYIQETKYSFLFNGDNHNEIFLELNMERYLMKIMTALQRKHPLSILDTIVYMHKKEYEVRDIFTLLEAKRYHAPMEDVKNFMVHKIE